MRACEGMHTPAHLSSAAAPAQVVAPGGAGKGDNYARIVVDLHLKSAGTYSVRAPASAWSAPCPSFTVLLFFIWLL
jgi:hypothetical protein